MKADANKVKLFAGRANIPLAQRVATYLEMELGRAKVELFNDGELIVRVEEDVRGRDCFVIQSTSHPVNAHLMELFIWIDTLKRASAGRVTAVIPYFGYARQDRKDEGRTPITAKLVANLLERAGADRVVSRRPARGPGAGVLRHPRRPPERRAGAGPVVQGTEAAEQDVRQPRRGERQTGPEVRRQARRRPVHHRQAADEREGHQGQADHRRRRREERAHGGRHDHHRRHGHVGRAAAEGPRGGRHLHGRHARRLRPRRPSSGWPPARSPSWP